MPAAPHQTIGAGTSPEPEGPSDVARVPWWRTTPSRSIPRRTPSTPRPVALALVVLLALLVPVASAGAAAAHETLPSDAESTTDAVAAPELGIRSVGTSTITITWQAPSDGRRTTALRYGWHAHGGLPVPDWSTTTTSRSGAVTLTNLVPGSDYDVWLEGTGRYGSAGDRTTVTIRTAGDAGTSTVPAESVPTTPVQNQQAPDGLPSKIVGIWMSIWGGPTLGEILRLPDEKRPNYVAVAMVQSGGSGTGKLRFDAGSRVTMADTTTARSMGIPVVATVGGSGDGGIRLKTTQQRDEMIASLTAIVDRYGLSGIDWDLEGGRDQWSPRLAAEVSHALVQKYGDDFVIAYAPRPFEIRSSSGVGYEFIHELGPLFDVMFGQWYDAHEFKDDAKLRRFFKDDIAALLEAGIPAHKIGLGAITWAGYSMGWNEAATYLQAFREVEAEHPGLRGVNLWWGPYTGHDDWEYTRTMKAGLRVGGDVPLEARVTPAEVPSESDSANTGPLAETGGAVVPSPANS